MRIRSSLVSLSLLSLLGCTSRSIQEPNPEPGNPSPSPDCSVNCQSNPPPVQDNSVSVINHAGTPSSDLPKAPCGKDEVRRCQLGAACSQHADCASNACDYHGVCIADRSCVSYYGGASCGANESEIGGTHESCCKTLPVSGYTDDAHPGKTVFLDKYEITAGRMRAFVNAVIAEMGKPDFKGWVALHRPATWDDSWTQFLPSDYEGDTITVNRLLAGDPRHLNDPNPGPGVIEPPATDPIVNTGLNHQFNGSAIFADTHGGNCGTYAGSYGLNTYWYPGNVLTTVGEASRIDGHDTNGNVITAQNALDSKSLNCATNIMFQLLCSFDGGELSSSEVFDYITDSPTDRPLDVSGCGVQFSNHGDLLGNITSTSVFTGGRCAPAYGGLVNLFFDAGQALPVPGSPLNQNFYHYPDLGNSTSDKSWAIAAPGRMYGDVVRISPGDEPWMDIAGNLTEAVLETTNGSFTGKFSLRGQGVGFGSERSDLNVLQLPLMVGNPLPTTIDNVDQGILRVERGEVKSGLVTGRCVRFK